MKMETTTLTEFSNGDMATAEQLVGSVNRNKSKANLTILVRKFNQSFKVFKDRVD